jgi:hypothetical protein
MSGRFEALAQVIAPRLLVSVIETSARLSALGVPHALIGGLAVGFHGHPRATKDIDFLVGWEAFTKTEPLLVYREELTHIVQIGVIDLLAVPTDHPELAELLEIRTDGSVPVIQPEPLILLKLAADRPQDRADVAALIHAGVNTTSVVDYLRQNAPELEARFWEAVA